VADAFDRHGYGILRHIRGECAAIVLDLDARALFATAALASREPLAFARIPGGVVVSTRVLALLRHPSVSRALDEGYLAHVVTGLSYPPPGTTALHAIRRLRPGEALVAREGEVKIIPADELVARRPRGGGTLAECVDEFWETLEGAARRRAATATRPALAMSGGVDSAAVAVALSSSVRPLEAFSMVASGRPDEQDGLAEIERALPVRLTSIECSSATDLEDFRGFDLRDDPILVPLAFAPAHVRLWKAARAAGIDTLFEGDGGDELFSLNVSPLQLLRAGHGVSALSHVVAARSPRSLFWRSLVLPHLPGAARRIWFRRWEADPNVLPTYLVPARERDPLVRTALRQYSTSLVHTTLKTGIAEWLSTPVFMGARVTHERTARSLGLETAAPLVDREVIERVLGIPSPLLLSLAYDKAFLREALQGRIPDAVRLRPKDASLDEALEPGVLLAPTTRKLLADANVRRRLRDWVRFDEVERLLRDLESGPKLPLRAIWQLCCLVGFAEWYGRASREYGVD
jgi:asparagine synthase (glutamine-hydrolysing)